MAALALGGGGAARGGAAHARCSGWNAVQWEPVARTLGNRPVQALSNGRTEPGQGDSGSAVRRLNGDSGSETEQQGGADGGPWRLRREAQQRRSPRWRRQL
ncbi:hypothetical protein ZWY2020_010094 [Hordeum vulgare]|nr:hypothetical protein ZWY2020_010094 [Hordeum vulgare]